MLDLSRSSRLLLLLVSLAALAAGRPTSAWQAVDLGIDAAWYHGQAGRSPPHPAVDGAVHVETRALKPAIEKRFVSNGMTNSFPGFGCMRGSFWTFALMRLRSAFDL